MRFLIHELKLVAIVLNYLGSIVTPNRVRSTPCLQQAGEQSPELHLLSVMFVLWKDNFLDSLRCLPHPSASAVSPLHVERGLRGEVSNTPVSSLLSFL